MPYIEPRIETLSEKKLVGKSLTMSFDNDRTTELWQSFMPRRKEVKNVSGTDLFCVQQYYMSGPEDFNERTVYEKWAAIEVTDLNEIPTGMQPLILQGGLYAVFIYQGRASDFRDTFNYIFFDWLPKSAYRLDNRPHFEVLGDKYKNNQPDSEEEIWIPIRNKE